jgi:hypothetical protein
MNIAQRPLGRAKETGHERYGKRSWGTHYAEEHSLEWSIGIRRVFRPDNEGSHHIGSGLRNDVKRAVVEGCPHICAFAENMFVAVSNRAIVLQPPFNFPCLHLQRSEKIGQNHIVEGHRICCGSCSIALLEAL